MNVLLLLMLHVLCCAVLGLRKKTPNLPTSYTSCRLNPHDQLGRLCVYGIYKKILRAPTKENALVLIAVDIEGRTHRSRTRLESELPPQQVQRPAQCWRASQGGEVDCDSQQGWTLTAVTQEKHLLFLWFDLFWGHKELERTEQLSTVDSFDFSFPPPHCSCQFYWHYEI